MGEGANESGSGGSEGVGYRIGNAIWKRKFSLLFTVVTLIALGVAMFFVNARLSGLTVALRMTLSAVILITGAIVAVSALLWIHERETLLSD